MNACQVACGYPLCSGCGQSRHCAWLTLSVTKRLLGFATWGRPEISCTRDDQTVRAGHHHIVTPQDYSIRTAIAVRLVRR